MKEQIRKSNGINLKWDEQMVVLKRSSIHSKEATKHERVNPKKAIGSILMGRTNGGSQKK